MSEKKFSEEIQAMVAIEEVFAPLEEEARLRVLSWAKARYGAAVEVLGVQDEGSRNGSGTAATEPSSPKPAYETVADFFAAASPQTDVDRALILGYWLQVLKGQPDFEGATVNSELKQLGHGLTNVTAALGGLIERKPQHVIQTRKSGSAKQARKRYKVTEEGKKAVQRMLAGSSGGEE